MQQNCAQLFLSHPWRIVFSEKKRWLVHKLHIPTIMFSKNFSVSNTTTVAISTKWYIITYGEQYNTFGFFVVKVFWSRSAGPYITICFFIKCTQTIYEVSHQFKLVKNFLGRGVEQFSRALRRGLHKPLKIGMAKKVTVYYVWVWLH